MAESMKTKKKHNNCSEIVPVQPNTKAEEDIVVISEEDYTPRTFKINNNSCDFEINLKDASLFKGVKRQKANGI